MFELFYVCPACGYEWEEESFHTCDSDCPECGFGGVEPTYIDDINLDG